MAAVLTQVLLNALSMDGNVRWHAEESLNQSQEQNLPSFLLSLSGELANDEKPIDSRRLAGLILKNTLYAKERERKIELAQRWLSLDSNVKLQVKTSLLNTLSSPVSYARSTASQVIAKVAGIELPQKQWPELIGYLLSNIHKFPADVNVKQATLETLEYLCEEVSPGVIDQDHVNKIVTAVVEGMSASEGNNDVRLAATRALYNVLGLAQARFNDDMERDYIMRVVCEATDSPDVRIRLAAFECLVSVSSTYYEKLAPYIHDIFNITAKAVRQDEEPVALQAVEFWSSICHKEIGILKRHGVLSYLEEDGDEFTGDSDISCFYFIKQELPDLVPILLETLVKQEEDQDEDEGAWNISMAGGRCLGLVARTVGDDIVPLVMPFVGDNITNPDWRQREAATYAFGSILEGPSDKLTTIMNDALNIMLTALTKDPNNHVKDTTAWTLGRMFEFVHGSALGTPIITQANCEQIITVLLHCMQDAPNVAEKACGVLYFLARDYEVRESLPTYFREHNVPSFLLSLSGELANDEKPIESRILAGLILKCTLDERWLSLDNNVKSQVMTLRNTLYSPVSDARSAASQVIAKVAGIELRQGQWPQLVRFLLSNFALFPAHVKQATLETLECLWLEVSHDDIDQDLVDALVDMTLTAVLLEMDLFYGGNNDVRLAATRALNNVLGLAQARFNNDMERDYIMRVVCEATDSPEAEIRRAAFECLVSISLTYYEKLGPYIQDILNITDRAVREDEEPVVLQAMEVWCCICHKEIDILEARDSDIPCFNFIKKALPDLVPMLLETLLMQEEIISEAGRRYLGLVARIVGDDIVTHVIPFIKENITEPYWRQREAASYAFRFILEGPPDQLASIITQSNCKQISKVLFHCMKDAPNVAEKACGVLYFLARDYEFRESLRTYLREHNLPSFLLSLSGEVANDEKPIESRRSAGLILKNAVDERCLSLDNNVKSQFMTSLRNTLYSPVSDARSTASQVIAKVAGIELRHGRWPQLVRFLLSKFALFPAHVKQATLETLEYLWLEVSPDDRNQDLWHALVDMIRTAVLLEMDLFYEGNNDLRLSATRALYNVLGLAQARFNDDMDPDYTIRVVCEATDSPDVRIRQAAFECLVSISSTYYKKLGPYIQDIFTITAKAVREDEGPVALQAVEFWSSICRKEIDIWEASFIKEALPALVPMLLETLLKLEGTRIISMAGGRCLGLVARVVEDDIVPLVKPFIEENITKPDWRPREAATRAFGSILGGPSPAQLTTFVNDALNDMLTAWTEYRDNRVKDTTAWTLERILQFLPRSALGNYEQIITVLRHCRS